MLIIKVNKDTYHGGRDRINKQLEYDYANISGDSILWANCNMK